MKTLGRGAALLLLAGCAANGPSAYVGHDVRAVTLAYGSPSGEIDLGNGARAFQWSKLTRSRANAVIPCVYTFLTVWNPDRTAWIVTGYRQPPPACAVADPS